MSLELIMEYMHSFFLWTISASIKSSIVIILILSVRVIFKRKGETRFQYVLWFLVILRLILPDLFSNKIGIYSYIPLSSIDSAYHAERIQINTNNPYDKLEFADISTSNLHYQNNTSIQEPITINNNLTINSSMIACLIWLIISILILGTIIISNIFFVRKIKYESVIKNSSLLNLLNECKKEINITKNVVLIGSDEVNVLGLVGIMRPKIIIPNNMLTNLNLQNLRYIFLHELTHLKRMDMLTNIFTSILAAFHWFNPIVWFGIYKMREDCEISCDSYVLNHLEEENESYLYASTIIKLAFYNHNRNFLPAISHFIKNKSQVKRRITMIKLFKKSPNKISSIAIIALILIALLAFSGTKATSTNKVNLATNNSIIIYCSHPQEMYSYGINIAEVAKDTTESLVKKGMKAYYLEIPQSTPRNGAWEVSRKLLKTKVANYKKAILLDFHIDVPVFQKDQKPIANIPKGSINLVLGGANPSLKSNKLFANKLFNEINKLNEIKGDKIITKELSSFNQDLSAASVLVHVGVGNSLKKDVEIYKNSLVTALSKINQN